MAEHPKDIPERSPDLAETYSGFLSYARRDDRHEQGRITHLREQIQGEFEFQTGIQLRIFQDTEALRGGDEWRNHIAEALSRAEIFIPIITPSFLRSGPCRQELGQFHTQQTDSQGRIIPIYYTDLPDWTTRDDPLVELLARFHRVDFRDARFFEYNSPDYRKTIANLVQQIVGGLGEINLPTTIAEYERLASDGSLRERPMGRVPDDRTSVFVEVDLCSVYVLQNVVGDTCAETVQYRLTSTDGIELISDPVDLREGFYNVTGAFRETERISDGTDLLQFAVLDARGMGRALTVEVLGIPAYCAAESEIVTVDLLSGVDHKNRAIVRTDIVCNRFATRS